MKDEEKSRTGNRAKADSGSGPEEEKNNETKGMPGNESEESEKGRRLAMGISMGIIFGVVFGKTIFGNLGTGIAIGLALGVALGSIK